jgi:cation diffusion facilitator family transporter
MHAPNLPAKSNKHAVALLSVFAAIFLTGSKLAIGLLTGSLGILSEALHSGLDLVAAVITLFSVRMADRPPDRDHHFGHGKVENLSALIETLLLLVTCIWIVYEAVHRLRSGATEIEVTIWSFIVVISSICIDWWRSRALHKAAKEHNSQALEADALHFSTDIWSSAVVLIGLIGAKLGYFSADAVAALAVAGIVIVVSLRLGKRTIDGLLDKTPEGISEKVEEVMKGFAMVARYHNVRIRSSGADMWIEMNIHVAPEMTVAAAHAISENIEHELQHVIPRSQVLVHIEPEAAHS